MTLSGLQSIVRCVYFTSWFCSPASLDLHECLTSGRPVTRLSSDERKWCRMSSHLFLPGIFNRILFSVSIFNQEFKLPATFLAIRGIIMGIYGKEAVFSEISLWLKSRRVNWELVKFGVVLFYLIRLNGAIKTSRCAQRLKQFFKTSSNKQTH